MILRRPLDVIHLDVLAVATSFLEVSAARSEVAAVGALVRERQLAHDRLEAALAGRNVILPPFQPMEGLSVAFIMDGDAVIEVMQKGLEIGERDFRGLVIHHQGENFCAGANLFLIFFPFSQAMHSFLSLPMNKLRRG